MLTYGCQHIHLVLGKQGWMQFIKATWRSHYHTAIKTDIAVSEIGSVYGDVSMYRQEAIWAGFSISVGSDVYFPRFQFRRYKHKTSDLINLSVSRSGKRCSTLKPPRTSHLPAPDYYRSYITYWKEKNLVKSGSLFSEKMQWALTKDLQNGRKV